MANRKDSFRMKSRTHRWRGVVEDFVELKLEEHSYECIYQHTENLMQKTKEDWVSKPEMVLKGVLPPLVSVLGWNDKRNNARLQRMAVVILTTIVTACKDTCLSKNVVMEGVIPHLHSLLKLRHNRTAQLVLALLNAIDTFGDPDVFSSAPECVAALVEATHCTDPKVKYSALDLLSSVLLEYTPPAEKIRCYVDDLNHLLREQDQITLSMTCEVYRQIASEGSDVATLAMMDTEILHLFGELLEKSQTDESYAKFASSVREIVNLLGSRTDHHIQKIIESGILDCPLFQ